MLEANPRASRTVPFVSKATAVPLAKAAARIMLGASIADLRAEGLLPAEGDGGEQPVDAPIAVKEAVLPFNRFRTPAGQGMDPLLGPEMKSTGEVMGIDASFGPAFAKSQAASYGSLPTSGRVFVSVADRDKRAMVFPVRRLADLGFEVLATGGTADVLRRHGIATTGVRKHFEGAPGDETVLDLILDGRIDLIVNTPYGNSGPRIDGYEIRSAAVARGIPCITTVQAAAAAVQGIEAMRGDGIGVRSLQDMHAALEEGPPVTAVASGSGSPRRSARTGRCASGSTRTRACSPSGGWPTTARGLERFALTCVDALAGHVAVVKPQSAFFERHGSRGIAVLERVLAGLAAQARPGCSRRCRCSTSSAATSAPRWTATPTPTWRSGRPWAPTPSRCRPTWGSARWRRRSGRRTTRAAGCSCWPARPTPRGATCSWPTGPAGPWRRGSSTPRRRRTATPWPPRRRAGAGADRRRRAG